MRDSAVVHLYDAARTAATIEAQRRAWSGIAALNGAGLDHDDVAALDAALSSFPDDIRQAPLGCIAGVDRVEATGPHDPGFDRVLRM
jgi:hypothetical protein